MKPTYFYLCAPSGAGKNALLSALQEFDSAPYVVRRTITREADVTEASESVTEDEFERLKGSGAFALDWSANGLCYGIRTDELAQAERVIINGSRAYWPDAKLRIPALLLVTIEVPEPLLKERLIARGRESEFEIYARLKRNRELAKTLKADEPFCTLVNDRTPREMAIDFMEAIACISD